MRLTFQYRIKPNKKQKEIIEEIQWHCTKIYNTLNYEIQENKEKIKRNKNINVEGSRIYKRYRKENWHSEYLHSHTMQEVILNVIGNHKSYEAIKEMYEKGNKEIKGKPSKPRYKQEGKMEIVFTKYAIREEKGELKLSIAKKLQEKYRVKSLNFLIPKRLKKRIDFSKAKMLKIRREGKERYRIEVIYEKEEKEARGSNIMAIDLGLNNLATCTNANNVETLIVAGESIKSKIRYYEKKIEELQRIQMRMIKDSKKYKNTKQIRRIYEKKRNYVKTYMHKASKMIVEYAKKNECQIIVIGELKGIKQKKKGNKGFVKVAIQKLVEKIEYKARLEGIEVEKIEERYTSGVSSIDKEEITKEKYNKERRITRGLFRSEEGKIINADINGSLNIMRKYIKQYSPNLEIAMDIGREQRPLKKRVA